MTTFLTILHILVSVILVGVVLLQSGKGASIGAAFGGGSSQTLFGSRGAADILSKITTASAIIFMLTSLGLAILSAKKSGSVIFEDKRPAQEMPAEKVPPATGPIQVPATPPEK
jgi:preprotein translocase subunit SecG